MPIAVVSTTLYLDGSLESQRTEILATEKGDHTAIRRVHVLPPELKPLHPTGTLPLLLDKHLILHGSQLIDAYFEERFPAPPLLPTTPVARSKVRFLAEQIKSWYPLAESDPRTLHRQLDGFAESIDPRTEWFAGDMFTLIDVAAAPLLQAAHSLAYYILPRSPLGAYRDRLLSRPSVLATDNTYRLVRTNTVTHDSRVMH
jgi:glutathione S-transferase